ncbi:YihY/virulence factor BrkB family protein [Halocalculus aciditolerans]|nr:YihY/virulence factor BrkB family protein [Halocalculus aciditolerans]
MAASAVVTARAVYDVVQERRLTLVAGAIAYAAFMSLVPLLALSVVVAAAVSDVSVSEQVLRVLGGSLTPSGEAAVAQALEGGVGRVTTSALGGVVLVWSALKVFRSLNAAFASIYGRQDDTFVSAAVDGLVALGVMAVASALVVGVGYVLAAVVDRVLLDAVGPLLLAGALAVAFLPLYVFLPDTPTTPREGLPGAVFAGVGWVALGVLFNVYVAVTAATASGVLGGIILLLTWLYAAAVIVLLGATVNAVLAGHVDAAA